ncbi:P-loop ATPase, Sll1717 family [Capnocytophaga canimorsus]|uniref:P-loop ATPase, Sll1717 family n=1 Tax=Capnocytophaga canimorsus TaxID=28188 RepID=UPI0037D19A1D
MNSIIKEIADNWKLEARQEDNNKYFFHTKESEKIFAGDKFYVIGRKGTGKTAISEFILGKKGYDIFTEKLSFKNFPFNELYDLEDVKYTSPNQYISIWKYIIYSTICKLMAQNQRVEKEIRNALKELYPSNNKPLKKLLPKWIAVDFGFSILGNGANVKIERNLGKFHKSSWIEKVNILEEIIYEYIDDSKYYIIFDELDEDYRSFETKEEKSKYDFLITSLFKAVQDIKNNFEDRKNYINPIIFLRDDIYSIIRDSDKNKWTDFKIEIDWDRDKIKKMIAHRISVAAGNNEQRILNFKKEWNKIFLNDYVKMGDRQSKSIHSFDFITRSTHLRPRDYIKYINECCKQALEDDVPKINHRIIKKVDKAFSNYLKDEIIDEVHAILPEIEHIFSIISQIRKWNFSVKEFEDTYNQYLEKGTIKEKNIDFVLQTLFNFSIIGNRPKKRDVSFFRYENKEARFNFNENIEVHRGLFKALQIL